MGERHCFEPTIRATYSTRCRPSGELSSAALTSPPLYPGVDESYAREHREMNRLSRRHLLGALWLAAMGKGAFYRSGTVRGTGWTEINLAPFQAQATDRLLMYLAEDSPKSRASTADALHYAVDRDLRHKTAIVLRRRGDWLRSFGIGGGSSASGEVFQTKAVRVLRAPVPVINKLINRAEFKSVGDHWPIGSVWDF